MRLTRSSKRVIAGVCAGIAEYLGWSRGAVRLSWVLLSVLSAGLPGILAYTVLGLLMPPPGPDGRREFHLDEFRVQ
jgi:phage shock protein C